MIFTVKALDGIVIYERVFLTSDPPAGSTPQMFFDRIYDWITDSCLTAGPPAGPP